MSRERCEWVPWVDGAPTAEPGWWICSRCGRPRTIKFADPNWKGSSRPCAVAAPAKAPAPQLRTRTKLRNWLTATERWKAAGYPARSAEQQHVIADTCRGCDQYDPNPLLPIVMGGGQCKACGCGLQPERKLANALLYATYKCSRGKWDGLIAAGLIDYVSSPK